MHHECVFGLEDLDHSVRLSLNESGNLTNDSTRQFLKGFIDAFAAWVELILAGRK